jgi:hypothetical protein
VQLATILHLLKLGHPTNDYEKMKDFFDFLKLKFPTRPQKHYSKRIAWNMVEFMHELIMTSTCLAI